MSSARRQLVLFAPPVALGATSLMQPMFLSMAELAPRADWIVIVHQLKVVLFALVALDVFVLTGDLHGPLVALSRLGSLVCLVGLSAWEALAGLATRMLVGSDQLAAADGLFHDPLVGGSSFSPLAALGTFGFVMAVGAAALALGHDGAPRCWLASFAGAPRCSG